GSARPVTFAAQACRLKNCASNFRECSSDIFAAKIALSGSAEIAFFSGERAGGERIFRLRIRRADQSALALHDFPQFLRKIAKFMNGVTPRRFFPLIFET